MYSFLLNRGNKDNIQYLYDYVKQSGTPVGEFSDFRKSLRNSENRKYLYDFISSRGEKIGSLEEFDQAIGFKKKDSAGTRSPIYGFSPQIRPDSLDYGFDVNETATDFNNRFATALPNIKSGVANSEEVQQEVETFIAEHPLRPASVRQRMAGEPAYMSTIIPAYTESDRDADIAKLRAERGMQGQRALLDTFKQEVFEKFGVESYEEMTDAQKKLMNPLEDLFYKKYKLDLNLTGDGRYNDQFSTLLEDGIRSLGAGTVDLLAGPIAAANAVIPALMGNPAGALRGAARARDTYESIAGVADDIREGQTQYSETSQGITNSARNGNWYNAVRQTVTGVGEATPQIVGAVAAGAVGGPVAAAATLGGAGGINYFMQTDREDLKAIEKGEEPLYDNSLQRLGGSIIAGGFDAALSILAIKAAGIGKATAKEVTRGLFKSMGISMTEQGLEEASAELATVAYETSVGNLSLTTEEAVNRILDAGVIGVGMGMSTAFVSNRARTAANSRVERMQDPDLAQTVPQSIQDLEGPLQDQFSLDPRQDEFLKREGERVQQEIRKRQSERVPFYEMISVRFPETFERIVALDAQIEATVRSIKKLESTQAGDLVAGDPKRKAARALRGRLEAMIRSRMEITEGLSNESLTLSVDEQSQIIKSRIDSRVSALEQEVALATESVDQLVAEDQSLSDMGMEPMNIGELEAAIKNRDDLKTQLTLVNQLKEDVKKARENLAKDIQSPDGKLITIQEENRAKASLRNELRVAESKLAKALGMTEMQADFLMNPEQTVRPEPAPEVTPETTPEAEPTPEPTPETDTTPEPTPEVTPETTAEPEPEAEPTPEPTPEPVVAESDPVDETTDVEPVVDEEAKGLTLEQAIAEAERTGENVEVDTSTLPLFELTEKGRNKGKLYRRVKDSVPKGVSLYLEDGKPLFVDLNGFGRPSATDKNTLAGIHMGDSMLKQVKSTPKKSAKDSDGSEGQFIDMTANQDGTFGFTQGMAGLNGKQAKFLNQTAKVLSTIYGNDFVIRLHETIESGNAASKTISDGVIGGLATFEDGQTTIHLSPKGIQAIIESGDKKTFEAVVVEEVFHATITPVLTRLAKQNPAALNNLYDQFYALVKSDSKLAERIQLKEKLYTDPNVKMDEAMAEIISNVASGINSADIKTKDRIRVWLNQLYQKALGAAGKQFVIKDTASAVQIMAAFNNLAETGRTFEVNPETEGLSERASRQLTRPILKSQPAEKSPLFRKRDKGIGTRVRVSGENRVMTDLLVTKALDTDATSQRIIAKGIQPQVGDKVGIRLNLNVMRNTGVPVQTMHNKSASGEALQYSGAVEVKNANLFVNQNARRKIVTFQANKFPMASVDGELVSSDLGEVNFDGVKAVFNPFQHNVFVDMSGRPIKSAEEATVIGSNVFLRGKIEYYDFNDPILREGREETPEQRAKRVKKGDKYEAALKKFQAFSARTGIEYGSRAELEQAYDEMPINSKVALDESEVAENMAAAQERAYIGMKLRQTAKRFSSDDSLGADTRAKIIQNPKNYIEPQKLAEIKEQLRYLDHAELIAIVRSEKLSTLVEEDSPMSPLAAAELINRAVSNGNESDIPDIVASAAKAGTEAGRILRQLAELKTSTPLGIEALIKAEVEKRFNTLTEAQGETLKRLSQEVFDSQREMESLIRRAARGEQLDSEIKRQEKIIAEVNREMSTFTNAVVERGWGEIIRGFVQGNLLTIKSQATNVVANLAQLMVKAPIDLLALPMEKALNLLGFQSPDEINLSKRHMAYYYGARRFGRGFVEALNDMTSGEEGDTTEWRINRGYAPMRSLAAVFDKDQLPLARGGDISGSQRAKLFIQGTFGVAPEVMFRLLNLGDKPFRRAVEGFELYNMGLSMGLEGQALNNFLKYPDPKSLERARREGRKLTFQEETTASKIADAALSPFEVLFSIPSQVVKRIKDPLYQRVFGKEPATSGGKGINVDEFGKTLLRVAVPYRRTPANILMETLNYASMPVALARFASDLFAKKDPRAASQSLAKGIAGSMVKQSVAVLVSEGLISGAINFEDDEEKNLAYDQFPPNSINVSGLRRFISGENPARQNGDLFRSYNRFGVVGALMGAYVKSLESAEEVLGDPFEANRLTRNFLGLDELSAAAHLMDQSFLTGVSDMLQVIADPAETRKVDQALRSFVQSASAAVLPNAASAVTEANREFIVDRRTEVGASTLEIQFKNLQYIINQRTFGFYSIDFPVRIGWDGEPIRRTPETPKNSGPFVYQIFDVTNAQLGKADPVSNEIYRLSRETGTTAKIMGTPPFVSSRKISVPDLNSRNDLKLLARSNRNYTFIKDPEFIKGKAALTVEQMNAVMQVAGRERYRRALDLVQSDNYERMSDKQKLEALDAINDDYTKVKSVERGQFRAYSLQILDFIEQNYRDERQKD